MSIRKGQYKYKSQYYSLVEHVKMKHPETRKWIAAVMYRRIGGDEIYVRELEDFDKKFHKVD